MTTNYNIYVVNQMTSTQEFWCFLSAPQVSNTGTVYANSNAYVSVVSGSTDLNLFTVPVQYKFKAGASNNAVGLAIEISSTASRNVNLGDQWEADFTDPRLHEGPALKNYGSAAPAGSLQYRTNTYDQSQEPIDNWYANETFGIQTAQGFTGVTWAPEAGKTMTITPNLQFYIATGSYYANTLADMATVSTGNQLVTVNDFDTALNCTVTLDASGKWSVAPGTPPVRSSTELDTLVESHYLLCRAHDNLLTSRVGSNSKLLLESVEK